MAPRQRSVFEGSRALGYQESFFSNRNDMLQSSLDTVLLTYDNEMTRYEAAMSLYKDQIDLVQKERERLTKLIDDLRKEQIDAKAATNRFNAGQLNSTERARFYANESNNRFNASNKARASFFFGRGLGNVGADEVTINEARQAYDANKTSVTAGLQALRSQQVGTAEVPKTAEDRDIANAILFNQYLADEVRKPEYQMFDPQDQPAIAAATLLDTLPPEDQASIVRGTDLQAKKAAGSRGAVAEDVQTGTLGTRTVGAPDYTGLISDAEARLARLQSGEALKGGQLPVAPEAPDLIKLQRDEYFRTFFPGFLPAYRMNEMLKGLSSASPEGEALIRSVVDRSLAEKGLGGMRGLSIPSRGITGTTEPDTLIEGEPPRMAGDVIFGRGSPFVPPGGPLTEKAASLVGSQYFLDELSSLAPGKSIQDISNALMREGLVLVMNKKEDGRDLYTIERASSQKVSDAIQTEIDIAAGKIGDFPGRAIVIKPQLTQRQPSVEAPAIEEEPLLPSQAGIPTFAQTAEAATNEAIARSADADKELARAISVLSDAEKKGLQQKDLDMFKADVERARGVKDRADKTLDLIISNAIKVETDEAEIARPFSMPFEKRGGETVPFFRKPAGRADVKGLEAISEENEKKKMEDIMLQASTPQAKDNAIKVTSAQKAKSLYGTRDFDNLLKSDVGSAVSDLYVANKSKGEESTGQILEYIATEFPKVEDQEKAATVLFGLQYGDLRSKKLG